MAVELASAYISLVPSARGIASKISEELGGPTEQAAKRAGGDASDGFFSGFGGKAKAGAAAAAVLIGAALAKGVAEAMDVEVANDKLTAQLGLTEEASERIGEAAGDLYSQAYGDSLDEVNTAIKGVIQQGLVLEDATEDQLEAITGNVISVAKTFDQDLGGTTAAVAQLMKTGLATSADQALDILTRGFQEGNDKAGDLLDTVVEYSTQFRKVGLDGAQAMGLIRQGLQGGARDADIVADAIKEFSIRAVDGSKLTAEGFVAVGLNAEEMAAKIARGGPEAAAGLDQVLDGLRRIEDPVARSQAAVALFGTQAEDLGEALFNLDLDTAAQGFGNTAGAAERLDQTVNDNFVTRLETLKREGLQGLANIADQYLVPALDAGVVKLAEFRDRAGEVASVIADRAGPVIKDVLGFVKDHQDAFTVAAAGAASFAVSLTAISKVQAAVGGIQALVASGGSLSALLPLLANPVGLLIAGIVALGVAFAVAYFKIRPFRDVVDTVARTVRDVAVVAFQRFMGIIRAVGGFASEAAARFSAAFGPLAAWFSTNVVPTIAAAGEFLMALFARIAEVVGVYIEVSKVVIATLAPVVGDAVGFIAEVVGRLLDVVLPIVQIAFEGIRVAVETSLSIVLNVVEAVLGIIRGIFKVATGLLTGDWSKAWEGIKTIVTSVLGNVYDIISQVPGRILGALGNIGGLLLELGGALIRGFRTGIEGGFGALDNALGGIPGRVTRAVGSLGSLLWDAGRSIIQGLIDGINSAFGALQSTLGKVTDLIPDWKGPADRDRMLLHGTGELIMSGLVAGIEASLPSLRRELGDVTKLVGAARFQPQPARVSAQVGRATAPAATGPFGAPVSINISAVTNARPREIGDEVAWAMKTSGR